MKKIIGFDLDDTLAITKSPISDRMAGILSRLLENYDVCVITGGTFQQIKKQVIDRLNVTPELLQKFPRNADLRNSILSILMPPMMNGKFSMRTICLTSKKLR